jgi:hypothetical protein
MSEANIIFVIDPCKSLTSYMGNVLETRKITDGCMAYLVQLIGNACESITTPIPVIVYADGYQFTPHDWQYGYDEIPDDLSEIRWVSQGGVEAIMMDGLPYILTGWCPQVGPVTKEFSVRGYDSVEKVVGPGNATSSRVNLPADWRGKRVLIIRLDQ